MVARKLDVYRKRLRAKERELMSVIAKMETEGRNSGAEETRDLADQANGSFDKEYLFQQCDYDRAILGLVQAALARVEDGQFGVCVECGSLVEAKRLEVVPWARHCIRCQKLQDKGLL